MLIRNALVAALDPPQVDAADLRLDGGLVVERGPGLAPRAGEEALDVDGALVLPGLVNAHTHLYSTLARGMPPAAETPRTFVEVLERVWWRLDRALDEEGVYLSALAGGIEAALSGTTLLVDHHASPGFIRGSLDTVRRALEELGLRSLLCYETSDRHGPQGARAGVEENAAFARSVAGAPLTRAAVGAHAGFTLEDETLDALARVVDETGAGLHVHVAEDRADVDDSRARHGCGLIERYARHGLLRPGALLAHAVHLSPEELERAQGAGAYLLHNPRSNLNNAVGSAATRAFRRAALGTDGMDQDMLAEARVAFLKMREAGRDDAYGATLALLAGGQRLASEVFGRTFGRLDPGHPADLVICDYRPPTPLHTGNLAGHLLFGLDRSHVHSVLVAGRFVVRERAVVTLDAHAVRARAREAAAALWARMAGLS
jgi:putative selenium metabolism protein SsnA